MEYLEGIDFRRPGFGSFYDELPLWSAPFGLKLLEQVPIRRDITILDVGAGTGFLSIELAQRCGAGSRVIAVDPWQAAATRLREKLDYMGIRNVEVFASDAVQMDLPDASVDLIVSNLGINNFDNASSVLGECFRVAKPGATLAASTNVVGHMQEFYDVFRATLEELDLAERLAVFDEHVRHRGSADSVKALFAEAGFESAEATASSFKMRFADGSSLLRHYLIRLGFLQSWKELLPPELVERGFELLEKNLNAAAELRGELALTIPVVYIQAQKAGLRSGG